VEKSTAASARHQEEKDGDESKATPPRSSKEALSHPGGETSAQFLTVELILFWVRRHSPHCQFMCVDPAMEDSSPDAQALVNSSLGEPVIWDAALISPAHCLLAVWSSFFTVRDVPNLRTGISLADALRPDHSPRLALSTDRPPHAPCNVTGHPMQRYVTAARQHERHPSTRAGPGQVQDRGTGEDVRPHAEDLEAILGLEEGDTMAMEFRHLTSNQTERRHPAEGARQRSRCSGPHPYPEPSPPSTHLHLTAHV